MLISYKNCIQFNLKVINVICDVVKYNISQQFYLSCYMHKYICKQEISIGDVFFLSSQKAWCTCTCHLNWNDNNILMAKIFCLFVFLTLQNTALSKSALNSLFLFSCFTNTWVLMHTPLPKQGKLCPFPFHFSQ